MRVIEIDNAEIKKVSLKRGVRPNPEQDGLPNFLLNVKSGSVGSPTLFIGIAGDSGNETIEMDDCWPFSRIPDVNISFDLILHYMQQPADRNGVIDRILETALASFAELEIRSTKGGILFSLTIGKFRTSAEVEPDRVRQFLITT